MCASYGALESTLVSTRSTVPGTLASAAARTFAVDVAGQQRLGLAVEGVTALGRVVRGRDWPRPDVDDEVDAVPEVAAFAIAAPLTAAARDGGERDELGPRLPMDLDGVMDAPSFPRDRERPERVRWESARNAALAATPSSGSSGFARRRREPHPQPARPGRAVLVLDLDEGLGTDELAELGMAVLARVERGVVLGQVGPDLAEVAQPSSFDVLLIAIESIPLRWGGVGAGSARPRSCSCGCSRSSSR